MSTVRNSHYSSYSSDDEEEEWAHPRKKMKRKHKAIPPKQIKVERNYQALEEGEISSDGLDDDEDDGLDDNLIGGEEDKKKLEKMSEKEREEELFKRAERRDAMQARRAVKQKLKEKREKERAERASHGHISLRAGATSTPEEDKKSKKLSAYANVFSSDSDEGEASDASSSAGPKGIKARKLALEKRKEENSHKFHDLIESRRQQAQKKRRLLSDSEADTRGSGKDSERARHLSPSSNASASEEERSKKHQLIKERSTKRRTAVSERIFSSEASDTSDSSLPAVRTQTTRASSSSSTDTRRSASSSDDDNRGRSRSPEEELASSVEQLSLIRLSRCKMERWVHMPFFDELVKGCFVRINIGLNQGVPVYRCAEIMGVVETHKIYDLGDTRTNKGIVVRVGRDQSTFRMAFVSNSGFTPAEFESWMRRITEAGMKPPTMAFVRTKSAEISDALVRPIRDERMVEQIIQSKRRFQKAPTNFAMRKAELIKQRELAETDGDAVSLRRLDMELEELESQAERIDRRRTMGFKSITSINQRNRALSVQQAEEAIRKESEEASKSKEDDPFTRVHSQPVIVTKKYLERLRHKRTGQLAAGSEEGGGDGVASPSTDANSTSSTPNILGSFTPQSKLGLPDASKTNTPAKEDEVTWSIGPDEDNYGKDMATPHDSLHAIHNFEIHIDLDLDSSADNNTTTNPQAPTGHQADRIDSAGLTSKSVNRGAIGLHGSASVGCVSTLVNGGASSIVTPTSKPNRRLLNLQEYKKRHGLI